MPLRNRRLEMGNKPIKGVATAVDAKDAVPKSQMDTAISTATAAITTTSLGAVPTSRTISAGTNLTGGGDMSANRTINHATSGVSANTYTLATVTVDAQGHVTSASSGTASGQTLLDTISATGASVSSVTLGTTYRMFYVIWQGVSHNSGSTQNFRIEMSSDNGSSYSTAQAVSGAGAGSGTFDIITQIFYPGQTSFMKFATSLLWNSNTAGGAPLTVNSSHETTGAVNKMRFSPSGGSFDAGTIYIYGIT